MAINAVFSADFEDFKRGVQQADASLTTLKTTTANSTSAIGGLHQGLSQVDRILASMGINIGPQVRAIGEMANVSGKTAAQLGLVSTAALAVTAGIAGWQLGRAISEWLGLDDAIGNATASLLGWGDASAEVAGHKMDVINRAIKAGADASVTYNDAIKFLKKSHDEFSDSLNTSAHRVGLWTRELAQVKSAGKIDELQADLEAQNGTLKQLSAQYGVSVEALQFFVRETKNADAATKKFTESQEQEAKKLRELSNWLGEQEIQAKEKEIKEKEQMEADYRRFLNQLGEQEIEDAKKVWDSVKEHSRSALDEMATEARKQYDYVKERTTEFADHVIEKFRLTAEEAKMAAAQWGQAFAAGLTITGGAPAFGTTPRGTVTFDDKGNMVEGGGSQFVKGSGVTVFGGTGPSVATAPGVMVHPSISGNLGGGGVVMNNNFNMVGTQQSLATDIAKQISQSVARGTKFS